jgi:hypothetical protein
MGGASLVEGRPRVRRNLTSARGGRTSRARRNFARGGPSPSSEAEIHSRGRGPRAKRIGDARASALDGEARATVGP